ncbi:hypothetical protein [uncultured Eubacterium sp.]|uniref:hypothetical protein n=1 Tax=uncultured Eubacterium sp. TaxID=165185 RepID=UPI0026717D7B|nr:hypothetical protein [uncultured Eubacterium sp.]
MDYTNYVPILGTILSITNEGDCCSQMMSLRTGNGIVNFRINSETTVIDSRQLRVGMQVAAFYDSSLPVPLIFPPQYTAQLVTVVGRNEQVMINQFNNNLVATDNSLQLNVARNTIVRTINGQNFNCNLGNQNLLVYYTVTTRSIPPQTTPRKIVVLC